MPASQFSQNKCNNTMIGPQPSRKMRPEELQRYMQDLIGASSSGQTSRAGKTASAPGAIPSSATRSPGGPAAPSSGQATRRQAPAAPPTTPAQPSSAEGWRERGNERFKAGAYEDAITCYTSSIEAMPTCLGYANRAMAQLKLRRWAEAEGDSTEAIAIDPGYVKAHQRRGAARRELGNLVGAIEDFESALRLEPGNKSTAAERRSCVDQWMQQQGFSGVKSEVLPVVSAAEIASPKAAAAAGESGASKASGEELLKAVSTMAVQQSGAAHPSHPPAVAVVEEIAVEDVDEDAALPPLPERQEMLPEAKEPMHAAAAAPAAAAIPPEKALAHKPPVVSGAPTGAVKRFVAAPKAPRTGVEFERAWKGFKGDAESQSRYLQLIPPAQLPVVLKQALTPALLVTLLHTLLGTTLREQAQGGAALLGALPQVPRFDMNVLSLSGRDKAALTAAWDETAAAVAGSDAAVAAQLAALRPRFKV